MNKYVISSLVVIGLAGCGRGPAGAPGANGISGANCSIEAIQSGPQAPNGGSLITCANSQSLVLNGAAGMNGTNGRDGEAGANGQDGTNGQDGVNGQDGTNGTNGANGQDGTNAALPNPVQLCPGTPTYPSVFIEVAFCINNNLYAVYSANGGFLTEILPGAWSSNAIGSSCNFTVSAGCIVTAN